jgi:hypothetical protein
MPTQAKDGISSANTIQAKVAAIGGTKKNKADTFDTSLARIVSRSGPIPIDGMV